MDTVTDYRTQCLTQVTLGSIPISEPSLNQDIAKIFRSAVRIAKCLSKYLAINTKGFSVLYNALLLSKCFKARLWENSKHVSKQLEKIGITLSTLLVNAGITSFEKIENTNPREIELILKRNPPFGNMIINSSKKLPKYDLQIDQLTCSKNIVIISVTVFLKNCEVLQKEQTYSDKTSFYILIGDADDKIILEKKIMNYQLLQMGQWSKKLEIKKPQKGKEITVALVHDTYVGLDVSRNYTLVYSYSNESKFEAKLEESICLSSKQINCTDKDQENIRSCYHKCINKITCFHQCCKIGVQTSVSSKMSKMENFLDQIHTRMNYGPSQTQNKSTYPSTSNSNTLRIMTAHQKQEAFSRKNELEENNIPEDLVNVIDQFTDDFDELCEKDMEIDEKNDYNSVSFDLKFNEPSGYSDECLEIYENEKQTEYFMNHVDESSEENFIDEPIATHITHLFTKGRNPHNVMKWDDPVAHEKTSQLILDILSPFK